MKAGRRGAGFPRRSPRPVPRDPAGFAPALRGGDGEEDGTPSRGSAGPKGDLGRVHSSETELTNTSDTNRCQRGCQATPAGHTASRLFLRGARVLLRPGADPSDGGVCEFAPGGCDFVRVKEIVRTKFEGRLSFIDC